MNTEIINKSNNYFDIVPSNWKITKIKHTIANCTNGSWGTEPKNDKNDNICIRIADFDYSKGILKDVDYTIRNIKLNKNITLKKGDLLIEKSGGGENQPVGRVIYYNKKFKSTFSNFITRIDIKKEFNSKFIYYVFRTLYNLRINTKSIKQTTGIQNLDSYAYFNETIIIPSLNEQEQIAKYLDHKTTKIEQTITKNKKLINLLKEKRTSLINQTVTKGLNPDVPMKESGIEWIGKIPEHWTISKIKFELKFLDYKRIPLSAEERSDMERIYDYYGASGVIDKVDSYIFNGTYLLIGEDGANLLFRNLPLSFLAKGKFWVNNHAHILDTINGNITYFMHQLEIIDYTNYITGSAQPKLSADNLKNINVIKPPLNEENEIADYLDKKTEKIDKTIEKIEKNIELLEEYKESLIHHVVTGKIDVRGVEV